MLRAVKPRNARSKRAMLAREPKEVEDARTCIFVRGTHTGEVLNGVMKDLMALKRPDAISFSKKNTVRPFEDAASLEFWAQKNDASMFIVGQTTKKRPNSLVFARTYDGRILDLLELGVTSYKPMSDFQTTKATPGNRPLMHFASEQFEANPRLAQLKSVLLSLFGASEADDAICLTGVEHVISVSLGPTPQTTTTTALTGAAPTAEVLPTIHLRVFSVKLLKSGIRTPRVELLPHGPNVDMVVRRHTDPDPTLLQQALKRPKLAKKDVESGLGKKRKNLEVDEMGDLRGKIHMGKQDLSKLQVRKQKGLKKSRDAMDVDREEAGEDMEVDQAETVEVEGARRSSKRRRA